MTRERQVHRRMDPVAGVVRDRRQARRLPQHQGGLVDERPVRGIADDVDGGGTVEQVGRSRNPGAAPVQHVLERLDGRPQAGRSAADAAPVADEHRQDGDGGPECPGGDPGRLPPRQERQDMVGRCRERRVWVIRDRDDPADVEMPARRRDDLTRPARRGDRHEHQVLVGLCRDAGRSVFGPCREVRAPRLGRGRQRRIP